MLCEIGINDLGWSDNNRSCTDLQKRIYVLWHSMIERCYSAKRLISHPTYADCSVCDGWLKLSNFARDIASLPGFEYWRDNPVQGICLDKDIRNKSGIKEYNSENCSFVSSYDNLVERNSRQPRAYECQKMQVIRTDNDGEEVVFDCLRAAAKAVGGTKSGVAQCCNGKIKLYKGFRFRYTS